MDHAGAELEGGFTKVRDLVPRPHAESGNHVKIRTGRIGKRHSLNGSSAPKPSSFIALEPGFLGREVSCAHPLGIPATESALGIASPQSPTLRSVPFSLPGIIIQTTKPFTHLT